MVNTNICLFILNEDLLNSVFQEFYNKLRENTYIQKFFKSEQEINSLQKKQIQILTEICKAFEENKRNFKKLVRHLVEVHNSRGIPFELFISSIDFLRRIFIKYVGLTHSDTRLYVETLFDEIENISAKYYSKIIMREERKSILIEQNNLKRILDREKFKIVNSHIDWLLGINRAFSLERERILPPLQSDRCCFFNEYIKNKNILSFAYSKKSIREIEDRHKILHESALLLRYLFFEKKDYKSFIYGFLKLSKEVYNFTNILLNLFIEKEKTTAIKDPLTSLYNRRNLSQIIGYQIKLSKSLNLPFSIIMLDIDNFKRINDIYGHIFGDKVLQHVSEIIRRNIRKNDYAFRYGGEEFLIILPATDIEAAKKVAERIRSNLEKTSVCYFGLKIKITASFGVSTFSGEELEVNIEDMIKKVDMALYTAKLKGKNKVVSYR